MELPMKNSTTSTTNRLVSTLTPTTKAPDNMNTTTTASVALVAVFVVVVVTAVCCGRRMRHKRRGSSNENGDEENPVEDEAFEGEELMAIDKLKHQHSIQSLSIPLWKDVDENLKTTIKSYRIDYRLITIGRVLGKGQFGMVHEAKLARQRSSNDYGPLTHTKVAVKTLKKRDLDTDTIEAFLQEGLIMKDFNHRNVLSLVGVSLTEQGLPLIILPYMAMGNVKKYIMKPDLAVTVRDLLEFGSQIGAGMEYLARNKFVHRDLAARNCMIDDTMTVKVADFGLSRDIYEKEYYASEDMKVKLPVKWMAPESLTKNIYTTKSDVWSFGVLLWELMTRGCLPYADINNWEVKQYVQSGNRMEQPEMCPDEIYHLMLRCWHHNPSKRPNFEQILWEIKSVLNDPRASVHDEDDEEKLYLNMNVQTQCPGSLGYDVTGESCTGASNFSDIPYPNNDGSTLVSSEQS